MFLKWVLGVLGDGLYGLEEKMCLAGAGAMSPSCVRSDDFLRSEKGGSAPPPPKPVKMPKMEPIVIPPPPPAPKPPPPPAPPPTESSSEVRQAQQDALEQERRRKGIARTLLAGETGGYTPDGKKTLLG